MTLSPLAAFSLAGAMLAAEAAPPPPTKNLTLAEAETTALKHAPTLEQAYGQAEAAGGRRERARGGSRPTRNATGTYKRTTANFVARPGIGPPSPAATMAAMSGGWGAPTFNFWNFNATGTQLIYDFGLTSGKWR